MVLDEPLADWWFEDKRRILDTVLVEDLERLVDVAICCVSILTKFELFEVEKITLSHKWRVNPSSGEPTYGVKKHVPSMDFGSHNNCFSLESIMHYILENESGSNFCYPSSFRFHGSGFVRNASGCKEKVPRLLEIEASFYGMAVIDIETYSDAWLPYRIGGEPQFSSFEFNASNLEAALIEIEGTTNFHLVEEEASRFCKINRFRLDNFRDEDGVISLDENGRVL